MKLIVLSAALLTSISSFAWDCSKNEAQFIGQVKELRVVKIDQGIRDCFFKIEFTRFNPSMICPLSESDAVNTEFIDTDCRMSLENGQEISGYLVQKDGGIFLD